MKTRLITIATVAALGFGSAAQAALPWNTQVQAERDPTFHQRVEQERQQREWNREQSHQQRNHSQYQHQHRQGYQQGYQQYYYQPQHNPYRNYTPGQYGAYGYNGAPQYGAYNYGAYNYAPRYAVGAYAPAPYWRSHRYWVNDWRARHLYAPPYGYQWVETDTGELLLVALATGLIANVILSQ